MFSFADLAQKSTGKKSWLWGLVPPLGAVVSLLLVSAAIASGAWLWGSFWGGALLQAAQFLPFMQNAVVGVVGATLLNFWFSREINTFVLSTREARKPFVFSQRDNPTHLWHMVNHLHHEVNALFAKKLGANHRPIPMPRLLTFTNDDFKIVTAEGRNPGKAALYFSSGAFLYSKSNMSQRELAALIQKELVKIYLRRGISRTIVGMVADLSTTLQNLNSGNWFFKILGFLAGPLQFITLLARAMNRSYEYEAAEIVSVELGRGLDLVKGIDSKVCSTLETLPTNAELKADFEKHRRKPYKGPLKSIIRPFADFVDANEYAGDDKTGYRLVSAVDLSVREGGFYINELWNNDPRATSLKNHLRPRIKATIKGKEISLDNATTAQVEFIRKQQLRINQKYYNKVPKAERYKVIGPEGSGFCAPIIRPRRNDEPFEIQQKSSTLTHQHKGRVKQAHRQLHTPSARERLKKPKHNK